VVRVCGFGGASVPLFLSFRSEVFAVVSLSSVSVSVPAGSWSSFWVGGPGPAEVPVSFRRVAGLALACGCWSWCVRPSSRSFTGLVLSAAFLSPGFAARFGRVASALVGVSVRVVPVGSLGWRVSVPVVRPSSVVVPPVVRRALRRASVVGFSGSRSVVPPAPLVSRVVGLVAVGRAVVGCASGVDAAFRRLFPSPRLSVLSVSSFGGSLPARSAAVVARCVVPGGVWLSFPSGPCPPAVVPSASSAACFCGGGSGSWASLALAVGRGVSCFCWLPPGVAAPSWLSPVGGGWWVPAAAQLSLAV